jgi:hypothetical protein
MGNLTRQRTGGRLAFPCFLVALFLLFTPFEQGGPNPSMFPKYFAAGGAFAALLPLAILARMRFRVESQLVVVVLGMVVFHGLVVNPLPFHFVLLIIMNTALAIAVYEASFIWRAEFVAAISWLLLVNAIFITMQALLFYVVGGPIIDFHKMLFGSNSRFVEDFLNIAASPGCRWSPAPMPTMSVA